MGLSGRRRARNRKPAAQSSLKFPVPEAATEAQGDAIAQPDPPYQHRDRTGNTYRKTWGRAARELKHTGLISFGVNRGPTNNNNNNNNNDLMPARPWPSASTCVAKPNANLYNKNMVRVMENDYDCHVAYSLNKKSRWDFDSQLAAEYASRVELLDENLFVFETEARGRRGATRRIGTNAAHLLLASQQPAKANVMESSGGARLDRPLSSIYGHRGRINRESVLSSLAAWLSRRTAAAATAATGDAEGAMRTSVYVDIRVPCRGLDTNRCHGDCAPRRASGERTSRRRRHLARGRGRQPEIDLLTSADMIDAVAECDDSEAEEAEVSPHRRPSAVAVTLFDAMRLKMKAERPVAEATGSSNSSRRKKPGKRKAAAEPANVTTLEAATSGGTFGYSSSEEAEAKADARLAKAVATVLRQARPWVRVPAEAASAGSLARLFAGTGALCIGDSLPRKLAILLRPDLTESVAFEEAAPEDASGFVTFAVRHNFASAAAGTHDALASSRMTTAAEVATQADPFAYLRGLVAATTPDGPAAITAATLEAGDGRMTVGWCRAEVLPPEAHNRLSAIRALPMFAAAESPSEEVLAASAAECEICCLSLMPPATTFADGSTALGRCGHRFCNPCWVRHVAGCVAGGRTLVACPAYQCQNAVDAATLLWYCPAWLLVALASAAFRVWLAQRRPPPRSCPAPRCGRLLQQLGGSGRGDGLGFNAVCACRDALCLLCGREPHWPADCATADEYRRQMAARGHAKLDPSDLLAVATVNAKQCPTCHVLMEKGMGCHHMTCPCGEHFCWLCCRPLREHKGACSERSMRHTLATYLVKVVFNASECLLVPSSSQSRMYCSAVKARLARQALMPRLRFQCGRVRRHLPATDDIVGIAVQASYLLEYACAHLDARRDGCGGARRMALAAARTVGDRIADTIDTVAAELRDLGRLLRDGRGGGDPGRGRAERTRLACALLAVLRDSLLTDCRRLHAAVSRHRAALLSE